jgi:beta-barrel assembly-enhancing protease
MALCGRREFQAAMALLPLYVMTGCLSLSPPGISPLDDRQSAWIRLYDVAFPMLVASADWCPFQQEPTYGFLLEESGRSRGVAEGAGGRAVVAYIHPRSPAASAGLAVADEVLAVNTRSVADESAETVLSLIRTATMARIQPLQLDLRRADGGHRSHLTAVPACQFSLHIMDSDQINGLSNGRKVALTRGAMRFFSSDGELAWVLAHEIAHNVLDHVANARLGALLNGFVRATAGESGLMAPAEPLEPPRSLEVQADSLGAYIMARSGYDLRAIRRVWQRLGPLESSPSGLRDDSLIHPPTAERLAAFEATLEEIEEKRRHGKPLEPSWLRLRRP